MRGESLEIVERALRLRDPHEFDFVELMLTHEAARIFAGGTGFFAKTRRVCGVL